MPWKHEQKAGHAARGTSSALRNIILGGQDGLVNVLGVILAVATATQDIKLVIVAGLAATFAESISMAAVAYTSTKAEFEFYHSELHREIKEMEEMPEIEREEIRDIYRKKGFKGKTLETIVKHITSDRKLWLKTMMEEELHLQEPEKGIKSASIVGISAIIGSLIPLLPFLFLDVKSGIVTSIIFSTLVLFISGIVKAKITIGSPIKSGIEIAVIGIAAAIVGYLIGAALGVAFYAA